MATIAGRRSRSRRARGRTRRMLASPSCPLVRASGTNAGSTARCPRHRRSCAPCQRDTAALDLAIRFAVSRNERPLDEWRLDACLVGPAAFASRFADLAGAPTRSGEPTVTRRPSHRVAPLSLHGHVCRSRGATRPHMRLSKKRGLKRFVLALVLPYGIGSKRCPRAGTIRPASTHPQLCKYSRGQSPLKKKFLILFCATRESVRQRRDNKPPRRPKTSDTFSQHTRGPRSRRFQRPCRAPQSSSPCGDLRSS